MGLLTTLALNLPLGLGAYLIAVCAFGVRRGASRTLAAAVLAWTWATVGVELLGTLGYLDLIPLIGWSCLGLACGVLSLWIVKKRANGEEAIRSVSDPADRWEACAYLALAAAMWGIFAYAIPSLLGPVKVVSDGPIYHLYFAARWWKEKRLFLIASPFGESAATYFPAGGDVWFAWLIAGWGGDRLAKIGQAPFLMLAAYAVYAIARRLNAGASAAVVATCWFVLAAPLLLFSFEANVDTIFVAGYLLSVYFLMRYFLGDEGFVAIGFFALALGCAWGTKPTATVFLPWLVLLAIVAVWKRETKWTRRTVGILMICLIPAIPGGYWFFRNAILTGNPLYPLRVEVLNTVVLSGWYGRGAMRLSRYYIQRSRYKALADILVSTFDPRLAPFWIAALLGAWRVGRKIESADRGRMEELIWGAAILAVLNVSLYWILIPYRTQQRFMLQAVGLAAIPLAMLFDRGSIVRILGVIILYVHLLVPQSWPFRYPDDPPWDFDKLIPNSLPALVSIRLGNDFDARSIASIAGSIATVATVASFRSMNIRRRRIAIPASIVTAACVWVSIPFVYLPRSNDPRVLFYPASFPDYFRGWMRLDALAGKAGARIAYAGTDLPYYLMGTRLRNEVRYININKHNNWMMHDYHREATVRGEPEWPDTRPGWDRVPSEADYAAWLANLRGEAIDFLVVTRSDPTEGRFNVSDTDGFPIERGWADEHPDSFEPVYGIAERDRLFRIYRVRKYNKNIGNK